MFISIIYYCKKKSISEYSMSPKKIRFICKTNTYLLLLVHYAETIYALQILYQNYSWKTNNIKYHQMLFGARILFSFFYSQIMIKNRILNNAFQLVYVIFI